MQGQADLPKYTKVDCNGKEIIYWVALGVCNHITLFSIQCYRGDYIFCRRCNESTQIALAKYSRPQPFIDKYGGSLVS